MSARCTGPVPQLLPGFGQEFASTAPAPSDVRTCYPPRATNSPYRYRLSVEWGDPLARLLVVLVNPSTANEERGDPTADRVVARAKRLGFGAVDIANLFGVRSTDSDLRRFADPVGPENDYHLYQLATEATAILVGWGENGKYLGRDAMVGGALARIAKRRGIVLWCLMTSKAGRPGHPLYLANNLPVKAWEPPPVTLKCKARGAAGRSFVRLKRHGGDAGPVLA